MDELFNSLKLLPIMYEEIQALKAKSSIEKKWLSPDEAAEYLPGYTKETLLKKRNELFIEGVHFYCKGRKTIFFDKVAIDMWVQQKDAKQVKIDSIVDDFLNA